MTGFDRFSANQKRALSALLSRPTVPAASRACGVSERTIRRYLANDEFCSELRRRQNAVLAGVTSNLIAGTTQAVTALSDVLNDPDATNSERIRAATVWLDQVGDAVDRDLILERITELEKAVYYGNGKRKHTVGPNRKKTGGR